MPTTLRPSSGRWFVVVRTMDPGLGVYYGLWYLVFPRGAGLPLGLSEPCGAALVLRIRGTRL